jgi:hypothetical protein
MKFCQLYNLTSIKNITVAKDKMFTFYKAFLPAGVPYIAIYNSKKELSRIYQGHTNINSIIQNTRE